MAEATKLPKITAEDLFLPAAPQLDGTQIFVRRRKRVRQGRVIGPAQPNEIEIIKRQHRAIAIHAGLIEPAKKAAPKKPAKKAV